MGLEKGFEGRIGDLAEGLSVGQSEVQAFMA